VFQNLDFKGQLLPHDHERAVRKIGIKNTSSLHSKKLTDIISYLTFSSDNIVSKEHLENLTMILLSHTEICIKMCNLAQFSNTFLEMLFKQMRVLRQSYFGDYCCVL
jgi:hypothetical protein